MSSDFTFIERSWLRSTFELRCLTGSIKRNTIRFEQEANRILKIVNECDYDLLGCQTNISRLVGIPRSACHWSAFMVLDFLRRQNELAIHAIRGLIRDDGSPTNSMFRYFEPNDVGANCIDDFQDSVWQYVGLINNFDESNAFRGSTGSLIHPLYGSLDVKRLHCFCGFQLSIHRRQILKILAHEGVV